MNLTFNARVSLLLLGTSPAAVLLCAAPSAVAQATQAPAVVNEASPSWLALRTLPQATKEQLGHAENGKAFLLTDWQIRGTDQGYDAYWRIASQVIDRSGLESAGQITVGFDPRRETLALNFVHVIRDGKIIDRTGDVQFTVTEHESDLSDGIINGSVQAITNLKDIRVGDIVDYATTTHARTTLWPGDYFTSFTDRFSEPLAYRALRIVWPAEHPLTFKSTNSAIRFTEKPLGAMREWEWIGTNWPFEPGENNVPAWYPQFGRVDVSSMKDWAQVARWAAGLYAGDETLTPDFEQRLADIALRWPKPEDRATEITRYVQDNIRYVGEELGEGSYVPRRPAVVLERGYGDCKDKSLLLAVALRRLGIEAVPALVSTTPGYDLPDTLPSPLAFDHVIVRVTLAGKVVWLDPTGSHRGGRGLTMVPARLGYGLPIKAGQTRLEEIGGFDALAGTMDVIEKFTVDEKAATPLTLHVETRYSDSLADGMRSRIATRSVANIDRDSLDFYRKRFIGMITSKPLEVRDERDANRLLIIEDYTLSKADFAKEKVLSELETNAYALSGSLPERKAGPRKQPLELPASITRDQVIEITAKGRTPWVPETIEASAAGIDFSRKASLSGNTVRIVYHLATGNRNVVPAKDAEAVYAVSDKVSDATGLRFFLDKSVSDPSVSPERQALAASSGDLEKVATLMAKPDDASHIEALSIVNQVAQKVSRPSSAAGLVDGLKGALLLQLGRQGPAKAALLSSLEQYHGNADMIVALVALQVDEGVPAPLFKTLNTALEFQPTVVEKLNEKWVRYVQSRIQALPPKERQVAREDFCIILAKGGWMQKPRTVNGEAMLSCAIQAHVQRGQIGEARAPLAKGPSPETLMQLAVDNRYVALWQDLERSVANGFKDDIEREVSEATDAARSRPDDFDAAMRLVRALRGVGKPERAVTAGKILAARKDKIEASGDPAFWFVNEYAYALAEAGDIDAAIAQMDGLLALGIDTYPSLVSQAINRAQMLNEWGRAEQATAAFKEVEDKYGTNASLFGKMWIWAGRACALRQLGRADEAKTFDSKLAEKPEENRAAATMAAACRGDTATMESQLLARLDDPERRNDALQGFIHFTGPDKASARVLSLRKLMDEVRARPAAQAKLKALGRSVPYTGARSYWGDY
jgi:transglutaminase-like putative cysteine protease/tetratricopeptide (TPR) repeat protein